MRANAARSIKLAGTEQAQTRRTKEQMHTRECRAWQQSGRACGCDANMSRDTMHAQAQRCARNLGLTIWKAEEQANTWSAREQEMEIHRNNGQEQLSLGEIIWVRHRTTGDERLAAFYGTNVHNIGEDKMALAWIPYFACKQKGKAPNILGRKVDAEQRGLDITKVYIEGQELKRAYNRQTGDKREILARLSEQLDNDLPANLQQIPGIDSYWIENWRDWDIWRVTAPRQELTQRWRRQGLYKKKTIYVRVLEEIRDSVDL